MEKVKNEKLIEWRIELEQRLESYEQVIKEFEKEIKLLEDKKVVIEMVLTNNTNGTSEHTINEYKEFIGFNDIIHQLEVQRNKLIKYREEQSQKKVFLNRTINAIEMFETY